MIDQPSGIWLEGGKPNQVRNKVRACAKCDGTL